LQFDAETVRLSPDAFAPRFVRWITEELEPITYVEAIRRHPLLAQERQRRSRTLHYFRCLNFDEERRTCRAYDDRPWTCAGFPWYHGAPRFGRLAAFPRCGSHADVAELELHISRGAD
jgi:Fe-S-cluster containining protein